VSNRDIALGFGTDLGTVPTSGNTSRQQAKTLAVLKGSTSARLWGKPMAWLFFGDNLLKEYPQRIVPVFALEKGVPVLYNAG
jgi:hypothetical protein